MKVEQKSEIFFLAPFSPLDGPGKNKIRCTPRGTKVAIYHIVGIFMLNSMHNVVSLATCAESLWPGYDKIYFFPPNMKTRS